MPTAEIAPRVMLTLAPFTMADSDRLIGWVPDARFLMQWSGPQYKFPLTREQIAQTFATTQTEKPSVLMFAVRESPGDRVVGHVELTRVDGREHRSAHVARVLIGDPAARGRGRGAEMMRRLVEHAFGPLELETLTLSVFAFNTSAIACYRRLGFRPVEGKTEPRQFENETWDLMVMRLVKPTYRIIEPADLTALIELRGLTRENAFSREQLRTISITEETTAELLRTTHRGWLCETDGRFVGFAIGDGKTGELWVLAVLPEYEYRGIGARLLGLVEEWLRSMGWNEIWLWTGAEPKLRAYGFYHHHGWFVAGKKDFSVIMKKTRLLQLSAGQIKFYCEQGYLGVEGVFSPTEIEELRRVTDEFVEKSRAVTINDAVFDLEPSHTAEHPRLRRLKAPTKQHPAYRRALTNPNILSILTQLIGPDLTFNGDKLNLKLADVGSPVEWHQDWAFYPHTNDDLLAVGIAMDDSTLENGCLMVLPGTHLGPVLDHHQDGHFAGAVTEPGFRPDGAVPILLKAGGISIHHVRTLHGSAPNRSTQPRRLLLFQYCAADAWPLLPGDKPWETYAPSLIQGSLHHRPRLAPVPVQLPLPAAPHGGSIYENQRGLKNTVYGGQPEKK